ncbi:MAG: magnesium/cobalt transporter CorA [Chloroflexota bacterium]
MPYNSYYYSEEGKLSRDLSLTELKEALKSGKGLLWVDVYETTLEDGELLTDVFHFHRLAIEDCVEERVHPPKIDDYESHIFAIFHGINHSSESAIVDTAELAIFLGPNYVVSNHNFHLYSVDEVRQQVQTSGRPMRHGSDFLAYSLVDALVDNVLPSIDLLTDISGQVEEEALGLPRQATLEVILRIKRSVRRIHRTMVPQRELLNRLSRGEYAVVNEKSLFYFRDIYDHLVLIDDLTMSIRDGMDNALSTYLSSVGNRQNETMKVLAMVGAIFLPLTLLAGIYGMNFDYMPELTWRYAYFVVLGVMVSAILGALFVFWHRGWIKPPRAGTEIARTFTVERERLRGHRQSTSRRGTSRLEAMHPSEPTLDDDSKRT